MRATLFCYVAAYTSSTNLPCGVIVMYRLKLSYMHIDFK